MKGSPEWPDLDGSVLVLEMSEDALPPADVAASLTDMKRFGVMDQIAGLVFSRPTAYSPQDTEVLWRVVGNATDGLGIPVLANVDCGHTEPMLTVPLGVEARLDSSDNSFATTGAPTRAQS